MTDEDNYVRLMKDSIIVQSNEDWSGNDSAWKVRALNSEVQAQVLYNGTSQGWISATSAGSRFVSDVFQMRSGGSVQDASGNRVLSSRKAAISPASTSHACASWADVNAALNALGGVCNTIRDRLRVTTGHGLTAD